MTDLEAKRYIQLDALGIKRIIPPVIGRQPPEPGQDAERAHTEGADGASKLTNGLHGPGEVDGSDAHEAVGIPPDERGHGVVVEHGPGRPPPGGDERDRDGSGLEGGKGERVGNDLGDGVALDAHPPAEGSEQRIPQERAGRMLDPGINDEGRRVHGTSANEHRTPHARRGGAMRAAAW